MHPAARAFVAGVVPTLPDCRRVVELGALDFNGTVRDLFGAVPYTGVDLVPGAGVDVVADAADYRPAVAPDVVVCCEVLEHTPRGAALVRNARRMLAPGGWFVVTAAAPPRLPHSAVDGLAVRPDEFYRNVPPYLLRTWLAGAGLDVEALEYHPDRGDVYAVARKPSDREAPPCG